MSPEDKVAQLNVRRFPRIALEEPPPIGEPDDDQPETVVIDGVVKRVTTFKSLNARFAILQAPGSPSLYVSRPDFLPITDEDLKRRLAAEVVVTGSKDGKATYKSAFTVWTGNAKRHVYRFVVFTSKPVPDDVYNLFRGLGVVPGPGGCKLIRAHIREILCSGDKETEIAMVKLMA
jgi:hypothetical protein